MSRLSFLIALALFALTARLARAGDTAAPEEPRQRLVLAHYMPWYVGKPTSPAWGWHWTMQAFDPEQRVDGQREIASHYYPLIGPYDSSDPHVLEYHLLLMKLAGIDGVIVDWYGLEDFRDYAILHRNTQRLVEQVNRLGMQFAMCYEDQTIPALVEAGRLSPEERVAHAASEIEWLAEHWFPLESYVHLDGRPVLLSFGLSGLSDDEWTGALQRVESPVAYFSQRQRRTAAIGGFDWPIPSKGLAAVDQFHKWARDWPQAIPVAFPRFVDIYAQAKVHDSWGHIPDNDGTTFRTTLDQALDSRWPLIQIATWNDWGEGTQVEPSVEFGYRDLEIIQQRHRQHIDPHLAPTADDLRLPRQLLQLRRRVTDPGVQEQLDQIARQLAAGQTDAARRSLDALSGTVKPGGARAGANRSR